MTDQEAKRKILEILSVQNLTKQQMVNTLMLGERKVTHVLQELMEEKLVYRKGAIYSLTEFAIPKTTPRKKKEVVNPPVHNSAVTVLRIVFGFLAVGATAISVRFTAIYLLESLPFFWAWLLSAMMSAFAVASFTVMSIIMKESGRLKYVKLAGIGLLWLVVTLYSMGSTVIGQYNASKESFVQKTYLSRLDNTNERLYNDYVVQEERIAVLIEEKRETIDRNRQLIASYDTLEKRDANRRDYNNLSWIISQAETFIKDQTEELNKLTVKKRELLESTADVEVVAPNFYERMEGIFGVSAALIQFILSCFSAIFVDVISPLAATMTLFLKEKL